MSKPILDAKTVVTKVFDWQWDVSMPAKWTFNLWDYEQGGIRATGDDSLDQDSMETWIHTRRSIAQLSELYDEGKEFILRDDKQIPQIFDIILEYTAFVAQRFNNSMDLTYGVDQNDERIHEMIQDIIKLQNFGNKIFPVVMDRIPFKEETSGLIGFITQQERRVGTINRKLEFDPYKKYGIDKSLFMQHFDRKQNTSDILDLTKGFNASSLERLGAHL